MLWLPVMASAPSDPRPIGGRVDSGGRLIAADPELEQLQAEAGSSIGSSIALPQLAAVVRVAQRLGIPISRRVLAAGREQDIDMWVRAVPEDGEVAITIERWTARAASPARLAANNSVEDDKLLPEPLTWSVDEQLRLITLSGPLAELASSDERQIAGQPLTKLFRLQEGEDGEMPLLDALAARHDFSGQRVRLRDGGQELDLKGTVILGNDGAFAGFEGWAVPLGGGLAAARPALDGAIRTALRSPLDRIVQSATEMSQSPDSQSSEEYVAYAADIATAARHLLSVIRSLGERADPTGMGEVDLIELTSEVVGLVESAAKERGILIAVQPLQKLAARGESRSIVQILVNLIGNAVRFAPADSAVTVSFEVTPQAAMIHVADEGSGIDPADQERIFEPFEKGSNSEGSGLGLAIARRLARAMGGEIQLHSAVGEGSRFTLVLPAA
jgi:signal transduction histidine kinase